jgi:hypothetical protein
MFIIIHYRSGGGIRYRGVFKDILYIRIFSESYYLGNCGNFCFSGYRSLMPRWGDIL